MSNKVWGYPTIKILRSEAVKFSLFEDYCANNGRSDGMAYQRLLEWISGRIVD